MTLNGRTPEAARAAGRAMMIPGAWEPRRPLTYIPASDTGSLSTVSQFPIAAVAPVVALFQAAAKPQPKFIGIALFVGVMMAITWLMLWMASYERFL